MSASHLPAVRATAVQTAAALARYERHVRRLSATWLDMDLYRRVSREIDEIGRYCATLPQVAAAWAALLSSHSELVHALLDAAQHTRDPLDQESSFRLQEHLDCIDALARCCLHVASLSGGGAED